MLAFFIKSVLAWLAYIAVHILVYVIVAITALIIVYFMAKSKGL